MSGSEITDSSSGSGSVEIVRLYRCRLCPEQSFNAAELDLHRSQHARAGEWPPKKKSKSKPKPKPRGPTVESPAPSTITTLGSKGSLFEKLPVSGESEGEGGDDDGEGIQVPPAATAPTRKKQGEPASPGKRARKRRKAKDKNAAQARHGLGHYALRRKRESVKKYDASVAHVKTPGA